jgi:hypothetical protein
MTTIFGNNYNNIAAAGETPIYQLTGGESVGSSTIISEITHSSPVETDLNGRQLIYLSDPIIDFSEAFNDSSKFKFTEMDIEGFFESQGKGTKHVSLNARFLGFSDSGNINLKDKMVCSFFVRNSGDSWGDTDETPFRLYSGNDFDKLFATTFSSSISAWNSSGGQCFFMYTPDSINQQAGVSASVSFFSRFVDGKLYYGCTVLSSNLSTTSILEKATIRTTIRQY